MTRKRLKKLIGTEKNVVIMHGMSAMDIALLLTQEDETMSAAIIANGFEEARLMRLNRMMMRKGGSD